MKKHLSVWALLSRATVYRLTLCLWTWRRDGLCFPALPPPQTGCCPGPVCHAGGDHVPHRFGQPRVPILLSTHLIAEVSGFLSRAVLIHAGKIVGDVRTADLEEQGVALMDYVKESYHYRPDRVSRALDEISGEREGS